VKSDKSLKPNSPIGTTDTFDRKKRMSYNIHELEHNVFGYNVRCVSPAGGVVKRPFPILTISTRCEGGDSHGDENVR